MWEWLRVGGWIRGGAAAGKLNVVSAAAASCPLLSLRSVLYTFSILIFRLWCRLFSGCSVLICVHYAKISKWNLKFCVCVIVYLYALSWKRALRLIESACIQYRTCCCRCVTERREVRVYNGSGGSLVAVYCVYVWTLCDYDDIHRKCTKSGMWSNKSYHFSLFNVDLACACGKGAEIMVIFYIVITCHTLLVFDFQPNKQKNGEKFITLVCNLKCGWMCYGCKKE